GKAWRPVYGIGEERPSSRRDHREARSRWRVVSSARNQNQHANSVYIRIFRTGLRLLECSIRKTPSDSDEVQRYTPKEAKAEVLIRRLLGTLIPVHGTRRTADHSSSWYRIAPRKATQKEKASQLAAQRHFSYSISRRRKCR